MNKEAISKDRVVKATELRSVLRKRKVAGRMRKVPLLNLWNLWRDSNKAHTTAREGTASSMESWTPMLDAKGGTTMPVGTISGEPVLKLLISSVAANTQAHETAAVQPSMNCQSWIPIPCSDETIICALFKMCFYAKGVSPCWGLSQTFPYLDTVLSSEIYFQKEKKNQDHH